MGAELAQTGAMALIAALICILIYVAMRFEWRLALGAVIALAHDVIITLGVLSLFHIEIDLTIVASLMSVIGYSLNDSIVVSDRIRENFRKIRRGTSYEIMNVSLTQTLSRTIMTSATTLLVVLMLYIFGGAMLKGFSLVMLIGVSIGTISSIYVASALALKLGMKREHLIVQKVEKKARTRNLSCRNFCLKNIKHPVCACMQGVFMYKQGKLPQQFIDPQDNLCIARFAPPLIPKSSTHARWVMVLRSAAAVSARNATNVLPRLRSPSW